MRVTVGTLAYHSSSVFAIARVAHCREPSPSGRFERDETTTLYDDARGATRHGRRTRQAEESGEEARQGERG
jgi:hypothetical protein